MSKFKSITEITIVLVLSFSFWEILSKIEFFKRDTADLQTLLLAILIFFPTIVILLKGKSFNEYGITVEGFPKAIKDTFLLVVWTIPLFIVGYCLVQILLYSRNYNIEFPDQIILKSLYVLIFISLPEEFFFRGYLQTELNNIFGKKYFLFNVYYGPGLLITAFLFVLLHIWISKNWLGLLGLIPALLFGWLREKTNGLLAPILFHGVCDIFYITISGLF